jgi:uncharacterized protein YacL
MLLWVIRILFLSLCTTAGYAISQIQPDLVGGPIYGTLIGFGLGGLLIAIDEMVKGLSLRAFSAATFGLILGNLTALLLDRSRLFEWVDQPTHWLIRMALFLSFSYLGMVLAMRSNKEDFYLVIPFVRFAPQKKAENLLVFDTSVIIDGRVAELIENNFLEGVVVVPRFVLKELQDIADSSDPIRRARGRHGLEVLSRIQHNPNNEVRIHEVDFPEEKDVDGKLVRLARLLDAKLYTNDYNLGKVAQLQQVAYVNLHQLATLLKSPLLPGEELSLRIVREGKEKGQGIAYLNDGTMVVVNNAQPFLGQQVHARVLSLHHTGTGTMVFAELKSP